MKSRRSEEQGWLWGPTQIRVAAPRSQDYSSSKGQKQLEGSEVPKVEAGLQCQVPPSPPTTLGRVLKYSLVTGTGDPLRGGGSALSL